MKIDLAIFEEIKREIPEFNDMSLEDDEEFKLKKMNQEAFKYYTAFEDWVLDTYYKLYHLLSDAKYKLKNYFRNIWLFRKALTNTVCWDYTGLLLLMKTQIASMEENMRLYGHHLNNENHCKRMRECIHLLDRIIEDDYNKANYDFVDECAPVYGKCFSIKVTPLYDYPKNKKTIHKYASEQKTRDLERLFYLMNKHIQNWWD